MNILADLDAENWASNLNHNYKKIMVKDAATLLEGWFQETGKTFFVGRATIDGRHGCGLLRVDADEFTLEFTPQTIDVESPGIAESLELTAGYTEIDPNTKNSILLLHNGDWLRLEFPSPAKPHRKSCNGDEDGNRVGKVAEEYSFLEIRSCIGDAEEKDGTTRMVAVLHDFQLKACNAKTTITVLAPLENAVITLNNVFAGEVGSWDYALTYNKPHTVVTLRSQKSLPENSEIGFQALLAFSHAIALYHGQNAWPYSIRRYNDKELREIRFNKVRTIASSCGPYSFEKEVRHSLELVIEKAFLFFSQNTTLSEEVALLLYWLRGSRHAAGAITVCALLETLIKAIYEEKVYPNETQIDKDRYDRNARRPMAISEVFEKTIRVLHLDWSTWQHSFEQWYDIRNQLLHRGTKAGNPDGESLHDIELAITQATYKIIFRLLDIE